MGGRVAASAYGFWRAFVASQVRDAGLTDDALPDVLLAPLAPEVYQYQRHQLDSSVTDIKRTLGRRVVAFPE